jgi:hypothetical protein
MAHIHIDRRITGVDAHRRLKPLRG